MPVACQSREVTEPQRDLSAKLTEGLRSCALRKNSGLCPPMLAPSILRQSNRNVRLRARDPISQLR